MLFHVPASLDGLLSLLAGCFTQPTFQTFRGLLVGQVVASDARTVCGMLVGAGLSGVWDHSRAHRFFSQARWRPDELGVRVAAVICERLLAADQAVVVAIDDTLLQRWGRRVYGCFYHHDATANSGRYSMAWGNNWVVAGIVVQLPILARPICLPVLMRLWRPKRRHVRPQDQDPERPTKPRLAVQLVSVLANHLNGRSIHVVADPGFTSSAWQALPARVSVTFRLRRTATLYEPKPPPTGKRGRPATKGARLPTLAQIATDPATRWEPITARRYGREQQLAAHLRPCLWCGSLGKTPVRLLLIQNRSYRSGHELALITTDLDATAPELIERYADRWAIEVCFEEAKHIFGLGQPRNRTKHAVNRTVPFQLLAMTLTTIWYALHGHHPNDITERRRNAPWYQTKTNPSLQDMLHKLRRTITTPQFSPRRLDHTEQAQIRAIQQALAASLP